MARWVPSGNGGYTDMDQHVPIENIAAWQSKLYLYSCFLYYELDEPHLSDQSFDQVCNFLIGNWRVVPESLTSRVKRSEVKTGAHAVRLTDEEKAEALAWRDRNKMHAVTTFNKGKPFAWSYSKLKNFESCPKRHYHVDLKKDFKEEEGESLLFGNELHAALAERIAKGTPLPKPYAEYESWAVKVIGDGSGTLLVEQKLAITKDFGPCTYFDKAAWYRGVADVIKIVGPVALAIDWKTGKVLEDSQQLGLVAACVFAHHPEVQRIRAEFVWLAHDATTRIDIAREDMPRFWVNLHPRIENLRLADEKQEYPAKPGRLCKRYCPVKVCPHHGE